MPFNGERCPFAFGGDGSGVGYDLSEPTKFLTVLRELDIRLVCVTAGSPYYNFHIQRPAIFPPSDGYLLPEDPLVGVARQIKITAELESGVSRPNNCGLWLFVPAGLAAKCGAGGHQARDGGFCRFGSHGAQLSTFAC